MRYFTEHTGKIYYAKYGQGKQTLIMVHGNGENHHIFDAAAKILAEKYTVILPDSPGHGSSYRPSSLSYQSMCDDYLAFIASLHIEKPIFYGFSDGGIIGLLMAIKKPDVFSQLIVSGANTTPAGLLNHLSCYYALRNFFIPDPLIKLMLAEPNITNESLQSIRVKTVILVGEKDVIKRRHSLNIAKNIPGAQLVILPHETHGSYIVNSPRLAKILSQYL